MNIVFFGNTKYSLVGLKILQEKLRISQIVTISGSPVETFAKEQGIPCITTKKITPEIIKKIKELSPDFFVVEDYGLIMPEGILKLPKYLPLNIHHSLLPKYRGPAPAPAAILAGDKVTGVTIIEVAKEVDAGNIFAQEEYQMDGKETTDSLLELLNMKGVSLIIEVIHKLSKDPNWKGIPQDINRATFTKKMEKEDGKIDLSNPPKPEELDRKIRAYYPWPGMYLNVSLSGNDKILKLMPNDIVQVEGKKPMTHKDFINGYGDDAKNILLKIWGD